MQVSTVHFCEYNVEEFNTFKSPVLILIAFIFNYFPGIKTDENRSTYCPEFILSTSVVELNDQINIFQMTRKLF